jgi:radical SAM superfamily enzyme YgiQ (UPF0313 family)
MRVLLVNSNLKDDFLAAPPIGLCYVATAALNAGHEVRVLDLCFRRRIFKALKREIRRWEPDLIGMSIRNMDNANLLNPISYLPEAGRIVRYIRALTPAPVVVGGSGASLWPEGVLRVSGADYIIVSDGEAPFVSLLRCMERGEPPAGIPGLGLAANGAFRLTPPRFEEDDFGKAEVGRWIDTAPYRRMGSSYNIQTKRGCPQKCIYCTYNQVLEGNRIRLRDPVEVVDEVEEALFRHRPDHFEFVDSVFNAPLDHCTQILEEIIRRPWEARFTAMGVSPRGLDPALLDLMWRAGFRSFMITPESGSDTMIERYRKGFTKEDLVRAAEAVGGKLFTVLWFFLVGGPGETADTVRESLDFITPYLGQGRRPPYQMANFYLGVRLYPGTELWQTALEEGFISERSDPTRQLWYVSEDLDLDLALEQLMEAAARFPGVMLGFDEKYMALSGVVASLGSLLRWNRPYWRHTWVLNRLLLKTGLRFITRPQNIPAAIRKRLNAQRYSGPQARRAHQAVTFRS